MYEGGSQNTKSARTGQVNSETALRIRNARLGRKWQNGGVTRALRRRQSSERSETARED